MNEELYFDIKEEKAAKLVKRGKCLGRDYAIVSLGTHPCAYVALLEDDLHDWDKLNECDAVHEGITFGTSPDVLLTSDAIPPQPGLKAQAISAPHGIVGWDYGHWCDYHEPAGASSFPELAEMYRKLNKGTKKWTLSEIEDEVLAMCKWLEERKQHEPK